MGQNDYEIPMEESKIIEKVEFLRRSKLVEGCHLYDDYCNLRSNITIGEATYIEVNEKGYGNDSIERPAIALLRVVLSRRNNYNKVVRKRMDLLKSKVDLNSFDDLKRILESKSEEEFFEYWNYKSSLRYEILKSMLKVVDTLREKDVELKTDYELIHNWGKSVDIADLKDDPFACIPHVAEATIQHLRMNFGIDTIKPDLQVVRVLEKEFNIKANNVKAIKFVEKMSQITKYKIIELDQIFVNYGSGYYGAKEDKVNVQKEKTKKDGRRNVLNSNRKQKNKKHVSYITEFKDRFEKDEPYEIKNFITEIEKYTELNSQLFTTFYI